MTAAPKVTPPDRIRKAWRAWPRGWDTSDIVYAPTASAARVAAWTAISQVFDIKRSDVQVERARDQDVRLPPPDPIVADLSDEERHCLLHAFGATTDPEKAGYRGYFCTHPDDPPLVSLASHGLMELAKSSFLPEDTALFVLTKRGRHVALSLTPAYRRKVVS